MPINGCLQTRSREQINMSAMIGLWMDPGLCKRQFLPTFKILPGIILTKAWSDASRQGGVFLSGIDID